MSNHDFRMSSLDDAIDRAVRDIIQLDPRPGLRRRVLSQLDAPAASRSWLPRVLVPFGVLATVAMAIVLNLQPAMPGPTEQTSTAASTPALASPAPAPAVAAAAPSASPSTVAPPSSLRSDARPRTPRAPIARSSESIFGPRRDRVSAAGVKPTVDSPDALLLPDPIGALPPLVLPPLVIQPLNLDTLPGRIR